MGSGPSFSMSLKEAQSVVEPTESAEMVAAFKRLQKAGGDARRVTKPVFAAQIRGFDRLLADALFDVFAACDGGAASAAGGPHDSSAASAEAAELSVERFQSALTTIVHGGDAYTAQFAYRTLCGGRPGPVGRPDFLRLLEALLATAEKVYEIDLLEPLASGEERSSLGATAERHTTTLPSSIQFADFARWATARPQVVEFLQFLCHRMYSPACTVPYSLAKLRSERPVRMLAKSALLTNAAQRTLLRKALPPELRSSVLLPLYSSAVDGFSLTTVLNRMHHKQEKSGFVSEQSLFVVRTADNHVVGAFASQLIRRYNATHYGDADCFLFALDTPSTVQIYPSSTNDHRRIHSDEHGVGFGGPAGFHGLFLDESFLRGHTQKCATFSSPPLLVEPGEFDIAEVEVWMFAEEAHGLELLHAAEDEALNPEKKKSVLDDKSAGFMLDLLGRNFSAMVRD